jgi:2-keto-3-deoxygluconate permease
VQVAASVIVTAVLTPILTAWVFRKEQKKQMQLSAQVDLEHRELQGEEVHYPPPIGASNK